MSVPLNPTEAFGDEYREEVAAVVTRIFDTLGAGTDNAVQAQIANAALTAALQESIVANCFPAPAWAERLGDRIKDLIDMPLGATKQWFDARAPRYGTHDVPTGVDEKGGAA